PNQQSVVTAGGHAIQVREIDPIADVAWKNNMFIFHNITLPDIMRQIERWYDVDANIDALPNDSFYGEISRDVPLSEVLNMIQMTSDLKLKIVSSGNGEERRVIM